MRLILTLLAFLAFGTTGSAAMPATEVTGAGSTFAYPFLSKAFRAYGNVHPDVTVSYQPIGSGGGIEHFTTKTVDFGASDVPMDADELSRAKDPVLQVPVTLGGVGIAYNLHGIPKGLHLTRDVVANIYLGKITKWNDPAVAGLNPDINLPATPITVTYRSDDSGTTYIFTDFLSHVSPTWKQEVGTGKAVSWPASGSVGGKGNAGVADAVRRTPGAIGYVELSYLLKNNMAYALLQNKAGKYVYPDIATVAAAAATKAGVSSTDFSIVDAAGEESYPISGYSWLLIYKKPAEAQLGLSVKQMTDWLVTEGQSIAKSVDYVPLPDNVREQAEKILNQMEVNSEAGR